MEIVHGDATEFDVRELFARGPVKVLGNLPYYVSSQILFQFTDEPSPVSMLIFTLQKELAERLSAGPRTKAYGALTLLIGRRWRVKYLRTLPGTVFHPAPKVDSAVVALTPRPTGELPECDGALFPETGEAGLFPAPQAAAQKPRRSATSTGRRSARISAWRRRRARRSSRWSNGSRSRISRAARLPEMAAQDVHGEIFDVVDENDRVTGQTSRFTVHVQKLRHRAVHIFVFNERGDLFLQKRSRWKDKHPGQWDSSAAGHVNAGDDYAETAPRELREELGVDAEVEEIASLAACAETGWEFVRLYRAQHDGPFRLPPAEIESGAFFTREQIERWIAARPQDFAPGFLECWQRFQTAQ